MASKIKQTPRRWLWIVLVLFVGLLLLGWQHLAPAHAQSTAPQAGSSNAVTPNPAGAQGPASYVVANTDVTRTILITGELKAIRSIDVQAPQPKSTAYSTITYLADEGTTVKKGDRIIEYDSATLLNNLIDAQRAVDEASLGIDKEKKDLEAQRCDLVNGVAQAEGNLKIDQINADIPAELLPINTYQQYQVTLSEDKLALQKAREQLSNFEASYDAQVNLKIVAKSQAEINLKRIQGDLDLLTVNAPQEGVVIYGDNWASNRRYQVGDQAFPGQVVMTLPDLSVMMVDGNVYDTELQFLSPGMYCNVHLDAVPGKSWRGKINSLTKVAIRKGFATTQKVFRAQIVLDSVDLKYMKPGMTAHAEVSLSMVSGVPAVPRQFLALDAQGQYYVLKDLGAKAPPKPESVSVGIYGDSMVQVLSGVSIGDRLVQLQGASEKNK